MVNVGVTLGYVKNQEAVTNWIKFYNVSIRIFNLNNGTKLANSDNVVFQVIMVGGQYSHTCFPLKLLLQLENI